MINCLLVDDEPYALELISKYIDEFKDMKVVATCRSVREAIPMLQAEHIDLMFLDVKMPNVTGMEFLQQAKHLPEVVLTTAYREHALDAYEFGVLDYLLKPISFMRFAKAVERYKEKRNDNDEMHTPVVFKSGFEYIRIIPDDIIYIQSAREYVSIVCTGKKHMVRSSMNDILQQLPDGYFIQVHKSYIVPVQQVSAIAADITLVNGDKLPLGRSFAKEVKKRFSGS